MNDLLLSPIIRAQLLALAKKPPHAILLVGPAGFGKYTIAWSWAKLNVTQPEVIEPDEKNTLSIEVIRSLYRQTRSRKQDRQVIIIDQAQTMGIEAQNAFLKLLEEPRTNVTFILTASSVDELLPTIASRTQTVKLGPIATLDLITWAKKTNPLLSPADLTQFLFMAQGRPGTLAKFLNNEDFANQERARMQRAKALIAASQYERLIKITELIKNRADLVATLEAMTVMVKVQIVKNDDKKWFALAESLEQTLSRLAQNGNPRAQLTHFFLSY